jgi:uncharacterized protein (DUF1015 family)
VLPDQSGLIGLYLDRTWYRLSLDSAAHPVVGSEAADPAVQLDVRRLQDGLLGPVLGIHDPRQDPRLDFVGGIRGLAGLTAPVDNGAMRAAFALAPTAMNDLLTIADAGATLPPKCTWFEPKLADGLLSLMLD